MKSVYSIYNDEALVAGFIKIPSLKIQKMVNFKVLAQNGILNHNSRYIRILQSKFTMMKIFQNIKGRIISFIRNFQ